MANAFKNSITGIIGTESHRVYKAPGSTTSTVIGLSLANISSGGWMGNGPGKGFQDFSNAQIGSWPTRLLVQFGWPLTSDN